MATFAKLWQDEPIQQEGPILTQCPMTAKRVCVNYSNSEHWGFQPVGGRIGGEHFLYLVSSVLVK